MPDPCHCLCMPVVASRGSYQSRKMLLRHAHHGARPLRVANQAKCRVVVGPVCRAVSSVVQVDRTEVIAAEDNTRLQELLNRFKMADTDGSGCIDREELRHVLQSTDEGNAVAFVDWLPEEELDRIMQQYDVDKNGRIDFNEFKQIVYDGLLLEGKLSEYEAAFKAIDSSGNGTVGATELAELFASLGNPMSYEKLVDIMQKYDKDESGQIDFHEMLLMFRDQLLDLKAINKYMAGIGEGARSGALLDIPDGAIPLIFSHEEFREAAAASQRTGRLLVVFAALTWCRPCKGMQKPAMRLADHYRDTTTWIKVFGNANNASKSMFKDTWKVRSTPCFLVFKNGEVVYSQTGSNKEKLEAGLREAISQLEPGMAAKLPGNPVYAEKTVPA